MQRPSPAIARGVLLGALLTLALALRMAGTAGQSYTMDEATELGIAAKPAAVVATIADGFPPLYHLVLKAWSRFAQPRTLSALLGVVAVFGLFLLARELAGERAGLLAALLGTFSPFLVWFSQEARAYALALPLAVIAMWLFARAVRTDARRDWTAYAVVCALGAYSHYYFTMVVALNALWLAAIALLGGRSLREALRGHALLAALSIPLVGLVAADFSHQSGTRQAPLSPTALAYSVYSLLMGFSTGLSLRELHTAGAAEAARALAPWIAGLGLCSLPILPGFVSLAHDARRTTAWLLLLCFGPLALCGAASAALAMKYKASYVAWASPAMLTALALAVDRRWRLTAARWAVAGVCVLMAASLGARHLDDRYRNAALHEAAAYLEAYAGPRRPILVSPHYLRLPLTHYLDDGWQIRGLRAADSDVRKPLPAEFWLVYSRPFHGDPDGELRREVETTAGARLERTFAGVELFGRSSPPTN